MLNQDVLKTIKEIIQEFFQKITFEVEINFPPQKENTLPVDIKTDNPRILIGERGQTLIEIQHLLKIIIKRKFPTEEPFYIDLDINDYKKKKIEYLKEFANSIADEVVLNKKEKILPPMSAYERRIIHLELANRSDIATESDGQEPERKIIVRPGA